MMLRLLLLQVTQQTTLLRLSLQLTDLSVCVVYDLWQHKRVRRVRRVRRERRNDSDEFDLCARVHACVWVEMGGLVGGRWDRAPDGTQRH